MRIYQKKDTKEILNLRQVREQWRKEYDGDDDTNARSWHEQYVEFESPNTYWVDTETGEVLALPDALDLWEKYYKKPYPIEKDDEEFFHQFATEKEWKISDSKKTKDEEITNEEESEEDLDALMRDFLYDLEAFYRDNVYGEDTPGDIEITPGHLYVSLPEGPYSYGAQYELTEDFENIEELYTKVPKTIEEIFSEIYNNPHRSDSDKDFMEYSDDLRWFFESGLKKFFNQHPNYLRLVQKQETESTD